MYKVMVSEMPHEKTAYKTFDHQNEKKNCSSGKILPKKLFFFLYRKSLAFLFTCFLCHYLRGI